MPNPYYNPYWLDQDFLEHHGVKGQSWGKKNGPPYPLSRGKDGKVTQTQKKKKQSLIARIRADRQKKVKAKQKEKAKTNKAKEKKKEASENLSKEELREKLLKSTDPKFIAKHLDLLETREIQDRINRINTEKSLKDLTIDKSSKKKVDKGMEWVKNVSSIADATSKAAKAYNDVLEASGKKEKLDRERSDSKKTAKKLHDLIDDYRKDSDSFDGISMEFDPRTGKISFKAERERDR